MNPDITQLIDESESVIDLEERLKESGHEFSDYREYMQWLDSEWNQKSSDRVNEVLKIDPVETRFPTLIVESDETEYQLHGILHGCHADLTSGWHLRRNVRDYISETADSFHRPWQGEDYLYEENMHLLFDLIRSQELEDQTHTNRKSKSLLRNIGMTALSIPVGMLALVTLPAIFGGTYIYSKTIRNPRRRIQGFFYLAQKALTDERYQSQFADFCIAQEMPQPFNIEKTYLSERGSKADVIVNWLSMEPNAASGGERSLWTAGQLRDYANRRNLDKLHYIGGLGHTSEIAYFLQNPDFSFERLDDYILSRG